MYNLILLRHGQSTWNIANRFTGWRDVDLSERGVIEASQAGKYILQHNLQPKVVFTSYLKRAIKTANLALENMDMLFLPMEKYWQLNERHYGALEGLNKQETAQKYGDEQVLIWRRSFDIPPPEMDSADEFHPTKQPAYAGIDPALLPSKESLKEVIQRMLPLWENTITKRLMLDKTIMVVAHGNSLRALVMKLENLDKQAVLQLNIPTGIPLVYKLDNTLNVIEKNYLVDPETLAAAEAEVANQGKK